MHIAGLLEDVRNPSTYITDVLQRLKILDVLIV